MDKCITFAPLSIKNIQPYIDYLYLALSEELDMSTLAVRNILNPIASTRSMGTKRMPPV